ncbi:T9SS type A sorting domain-containing protein [Hymenobacter negativus]|uniref:T9SS type A sorting domain-containing protein n=1 Tax=Hymenobacter negativus TaxID=2795026 RepID=A0ABS3QCE9_9BACT|nr:T9SS type A sorting domain-containing protein [Hymenobacter negativus]MBO2008921.1 T9SS type A sorting domain-containing protein [Hymenobacter negativus]
MKKLLLALITTLPLAGWSQSLTQADFTGVVVPQYLSSGNNSGSATFSGPRLAIVFRATVSNLTPSTLYRYYVQAATASEFTSSASGAGVLLLIAPGATTAATTYTSVSTGSLSTAGSYATFTTDATGSYTGWFALVNSNNASRFQVPGTVLFPTITLATDATPATVVARRALNQSMTLLSFTSGAGANNGTLLTGSSAATPKNVVFTYDNAAGTGRPLSGAVVESIGAATGTTQTGTNAYTYSTTNGSYTTVVPNTLTTGVRRVEERSIVTGAVLNCNTDADGVWASGATTVNPTGGTTAVVLTATDTPLSAGCATVSATLPNNALPGLTISPNPATDRITVALPTKGAATVALRDLTGRVVMAPAALPGNQQVLLPASLAHGIYLLEVRQGDVTAVRRIEKN